MAGIFKPLRSVMVSTSAPNFDEDMDSRALASVCITPSPVSIFPRIVFAGSSEIAGEAAFLSSAASSGDDGSSGRILPLHIINAPQLMHIRTKSIAFFDDCTDSKPDCDLPPSSELPGVFRCRMRPFLIKIRCQAYLVWGGLLLFSLFTRNFPTVCGFLKYFWGRALGSVL